MRGFLRLSALLLTGFPGLGLLSQTALPAGELTPDTLSRFCAAQTATPCIVSLAGQDTLSLRGDWHVPRLLHLRFASGSALHVQGGMLQFDGGSIEAPADGTIFPEGDRIRSLAAARPEWFAPPPGQEPVPASAVLAAYQATGAWGTVYLQARAYVSPFTACAPGDAHFLSPRTFVGAGRPAPDDPENPSHLEGGTVLLGGITGTAPLRLAHLGVDAGPQVSAGLLRGCQPPGIFIEQPGHQFVSGDRLEDVAVLTTGAFNMHSVMIAGHQNTEVRGLWIWTLGGTHGLVMKSSNSVVDGLHCWGAVSDCLIVKSDYVTDFQGRAVHDRVAHVDIHPLRPGGYVAGIMVDSRWDTVRDLEMDDISETGTIFGVILLGSPYFEPQNISISHWKAERPTGVCLYADRASHVRVSDFDCELHPDAGAGVELLGAQDVVLQNGVVRCRGKAAQCAANHADGVLDDGESPTFRQVTLERLGGFALRGKHPAEDWSGLRLVGMPGRVFAPYALPLRLRALALVNQIKPSLRIFYTAVQVRLQLYPARVSFLAAALVLAVAFVEARGLARRRMR